MKKPEDAGTPGDRLLLLMVAQLRQSLTEGMRCLHAGDAAAARSFFGEALTQNARLLAVMAQEDDHVTER